MLVLRDCDHIRLFGHGGNAKGREQATLFSFERTPNFLFANAVDGLTKIGSKTLSHREGSTDPRRWHMLIDRFDGSAELKLPPLERPVLHLRGSPQPGFRVELFNLNAPQMSERRLSQILVSRGIDGVIVGPLTEGGGLVDRGFEWSAFASVMIEHTFVEPRLHQVCSDEFSTIGRLIQRLLDYGYQRIGVAMRSRMDEYANHHWLGGYQTFQALTRRDRRILHFITPEWDRRNFLQWFRRHRPEAIITVDDEAVHRLRAAGVRVPEEVGCATVYWKSDRADLSGYYQNHETIGGAAVETVVAQLHRNERGLPEIAKTVLIQALWMEGATLRRRTPAEIKADLRVWKR